MRVFVTGGAGYIGSHTVLALLEARHEVCVFDNYSNSSPVALASVRQLTNADFAEVEGDIRDQASLTDALARFAPDAVIHFAGLKAVGESVAQPLTYYENNVAGSLCLLKAMEAAGCERIIFSSSATVYGAAQYLPFDEQHPLAPTNPYGRTKLVIEQMICDWVKSRKAASAVLLRYFNPVGAHASGRIGEDPRGIPANLMPLVAQVALGRRQELSVYGDNYETRDGTAERDFIHVTDLAHAHLAALNFSSANTGCEAINVGTGRGLTVLEILSAFEKAAGRPIARRVAGRREGDIAASVASTAKAEALLGWRAQLDVDAMCQSLWLWQSNNPDGYGAA